MSTQHSMNQRYLLFHPTSLNRPGFPDTTQLLFIFHTVCCTCTTDFSSSIKEQMVFPCGADLMYWPQPCSTCHQNFCSEPFLKKSLNCCRGVWDLKFGWCRTSIRSSIFSYRKGQREGYASVTICMAALHV